MAQVGYLKSLIIFNLFLALLGLSLVKSTLYKPNLFQPNYGPSRLPEEPNFFQPFSGPSKSRSREEYPVQIRSKSRSCQEYLGCYRRQRLRKNGEVYFKYEPRVNLNNKRLPLKEYDTLEEAALVHDVAKYCLGIKHGHFNFTLEQDINFQQIPSELPHYKIVELVLKRAKDIRQQKTYQKACSMPPSNVFDPPNPSCDIQDLEVFTESQDDPTNNYLSSPYNQSLSIEDYEDWATMVDGTTSNRVLPEFDTGFESWAMGVSERTLCDHVEVQPNSIEDQSTSAKLFPTNVTERTFSEHVGAQQNSIHNEWDSAKLASAGPVLFSQHNAYPKSKDVSIQEPHAIDELSNLSTNPSPTPLFHIEIRSPLGVQDVSGEFSKLSIFVNDGWKLSIDPKCQAPTSLHESNLTVERQLETTHTFISFQKFGDVQLGDKWLVLQDFIDRGWKLSVFKK